MRFHIAQRDALYGAGGYHDSELPINDLLSIENENQHAVTSLHEIYAPSSYQRPAPRIHTEDKAFQEKISSLFEYINTNFNDCSPCLALSIDHCLIHDSVIYFDNESGCSVFQPTFRSNDRPFVRTLTPDSGRLASTKAVSGDQNNRAFFLGSAGSFNYGHWLVDDLPRALWLLQHPKPTTIYIQSFPGMDAIRTQTLKFLLGKSQANIVFTAAEDILDCRDLTYATPVSFHPYLKNAAAISALRDAVRKRLPKSLGRNRRLFVQRRSDRGRKILNIDEVQAVVRQQNFTFFDPDLHTFEKQAMAFAHSDLIVGTMCAAMCSTIFSRTGSTVVHLAPNDWVEPFYWDLASVLDHNYVALHGKRAHANEAPHLDDFYVNIDALKNTLREFDV